MKKFIQSNPIEILFSILFLTLAAILNLQFLEGANINGFGAYVAKGTNGGFVGGQDEYLTVKEVYSIVQPQSFKHFISAIISGDIMYYGRVMFYTDALIAYIPYKIWGINGLVYAIRMTHSLWILTSFLLLGTKFLKLSFSKILFYFIVGGFLFTFYFVQMPKPEPIQLFFLTLFLIKWVDFEFRFGYWFIFLGLAYASKFNIVLIMPLVFIYTLFFPNYNISKYFKGFLSSFLYFLLGFFIGIPSLILTPLNRKYFETYISKTILGSDKPYDDNSLTFTTWVENGLGEIHFAIPMLGYLFLFLIILVSIYLIINYKREKNKDILFILLSGIFLSITVMLFTDRLWPHYIWTGIVLVWLGLCFFYENHTNPLTSKLLLMVLLFFSFTASYRFIFISFPTLTQYEKRNYDLKSKMDDKELYKYLETNHFGKRIGISADVYYPYSYFVKSNIYNPFYESLNLKNDLEVKIYSSRKTEIWNSDVVVFSNYHPRKLPKEKQLYNVGDYELLNKLYDEKTANEFTSDTTIGRYKLYFKTNNIK